MNSKEIREKYLSFFASKKHQIVASAPVVNKNDPTLMFTNAGMNQFKDIFLGNEQPESTRIADTQKCLRVSGKHNDLDDVGKDTYHHTLFEMLGNWSFGDYFKKEAIHWAFELLTEVYGLPKERLYATVFEGDKEDGTVQDTESLSIWKELLPENQILFGNKKDNFWEMGDVGPTGPSSEIHIDLRSDEEIAKTPGADLVNQDHPQVVEIWNLVFIEFTRKSDGKLEQLPKKHVDTGMGFERLVMALQGKTSNYDTDVFTPLIAKLEKISGIKYGAADNSDIAIRVVVDHIRAVAFCIADGQLPGNNGAGYVVKRIMRRAISYGFRFLNLKEPFLYQLVEVLRNQFEEVFPEIQKQEKLITEVILEEEKSFLKTIEQGLNRLKQIMETNEGKVLSGEVVFELYDTFGFPSDLSRIVAEEQGFTIDEEGFETEMEKQRARSKNASVSETEDWVIVKDTEESTAFVGYDELQSSTQILRYRKQTTKKNTVYQLVLSQTPFYAEGGGQVGDKGILQNNDETIEIIDTKRENQLQLHITKELPKDVHATFEAKVYPAKRMHTQKNHSATHLLHEVLRDVLGTHVEQRGSYVGEEYLRFDFSHFSKISDEELQEIQEKVNRKIHAAIELNEYRTMAFDEAKSMGAMALFGEKYGDEVRVIKFGSSVELCGGTHVSNTSEIQYFHILSESSIASGIRRIEAITGEKALKYLEEIHAHYHDLLQVLKNPEKPIQVLEKLLAENQQMKKQLEQMELEQAQLEKQKWKQILEPVGEVQALVVKTQLNAGLVKQLLFELRNEIQPFAAVVCSTSDNKPTISIAFSDDVVSTKGWNAGQWVRDLAKHIQGGGGGQPFFATAGGKNIDGLDQVVVEAKKLLNS